MRVTILGHAGLFVETSDQRVLVDPVFAEQLIGGAIEFSPPREFDLDRMPVPTVLVITHAHFDHFHPVSLQRIARSTPVITAEDPALVEQLAQLGFRDIRALAPWQHVALGATTLRATQSDHEEPEFGVLFADASGTFWHMADSEVSLLDVERLRQEHDTIDVIATKYQPVVASSMAYLRGLGTTVDKDAVFASLETACACKPRFVFPYAFGVAFGGAHRWFSRYALPIRPEEVVELLARRLDSPHRAGTVAPGDEIVIAPERVEHRAAASSFVRAVPAERATWEPVDTATLQVLDSKADRVELAQRLERLMIDEMAPWLAAELEDVSNRMHSLPELGVVWQLIVHTGGERLHYAIDFRGPAIELEDGEHPQANLFVHVGGGPLLAVLRREEPELLFWLAGQARTYEKIMDVRNGAFWRPPLQGAALFDRLPEPLTTYLRVRTDGRRHLEVIAT